MVKCPLCQFVNEDGALFCEQCKSDLAGAEAIPVGQPIAESHGGDAIPMAETVPVMAEAMSHSSPPIAVPVNDHFSESAPEPILEPLPSAHIVASEPPPIPLAVETFVGSYHAPSGSQETMAATPVQAPS